MFYVKVNFINIVSILLVDNDNFWNGMFVMFVTFQ